MKIYYDIDEVKWKEIAKPGVAKLGIQKVM
jgi:hypothetical protein